VVPRATELVKMAANKVGDAMGSHQSLPSASDPIVQPAVGSPSVQSSPVSASISLKKRIAVLEVKDNGLTLPLSNKLERIGGGLLLDHHDPSFLAKYSALSDMTDWSVVSVRLQQEFDTNVLLLVWAPDTIVPGKTLLGAVYDGLSGSLVRTVVVQIPSYNQTDLAAQSSAVSDALDEMAGKLKAVIAFLPWHGRVVSVENDRIYINAGREAGLTIGQLLKVYRGGKVIPGVGFATGERVATVQVSGFVGANGAYGVVKDGRGVQAKDMIAVE
jgi:hypothetical protein